MELIVQIIVISIISFGTGFICGFLIKIKVNGKK